MNIFSIFNIHRTVDRWYGFVWKCLLLICLFVFLHLLFPPHFPFGKNENARSEVYVKSHSNVIKQGDGYNLTFIEERNKWRIDRVKNTCRLLKHSISSKLNPIVRSIIDPGHKITYCRVNKVASTYTLDMLTNIFNCSEKCLRSASDTVRDLPYESMRQVIAKTYKFTFVREPYGRLFSTYSNKFYFPKENWAPIGPKIVQKYRDRPSKDSLIYGHNITFYEMIRFLVEEFEAGHDLDEHLRPMNKNCFPCDYHYNFIGKLETIVSDWAYLKDFWKKKRGIAGIPKEAGKKKPVQFPDLFHILRTHIVIRNSTISKYKLYLRAWSYYQMVGTIYKHIDMPFEENSFIRFDDFKSALERAAEQSKMYIGETKQQKIEAMKQAYASVPYDLLERLRKVIALDCVLYDYENKPQWIFNQEKEHINFNYFKGLS